MKNNENMPIFDLQWFIDKNVSWMINDCDKYKYAQLLFIIHIFNKKKNSLHDR